MGRYLAITYEETMTASNPNLNTWWIRTAKNNTTLELFPKTKTAVKKENEKMFPLIQSFCIFSLNTEDLMLLNCDVGEDSWESLGLQGDPTSLS